jgi:SH3 domain protein
MLSGSPGSSRERLPMPKLLFAIVAVLFAAISANAATMYISDQFTVPLRRGPSNTHKILHAGLPSGLALEVISEDKAAGFTEVRTPSGTEGWIETQYLTADPIARDRLTAANRRVQSLENELKTVRDNYQQARGTGASAETRSNELSKELAKAQNELAEIKRVSATAVAQYDENKKLKTTNQELQSQVAQLSERVRQLENNARLRWFLAGGLLVVAGLVLGALIKSRPKRSSWA